LGAATRDTCSAQAEAGGVTYRLAAPGSGCAPIGVDGLVVCRSPNGASEVLISEAAVGRSISVHPVGGDGGWVADVGALDASAGIIWSPRSDAFLFVDGGALKMVTATGGGPTVVPATQGITCPRWSAGP